MRAINLYVNILTLKTLRFSVALRTIISISACATLHCFAGDFFHVATPLKSGDSTQWLRLKYRQIPPTIYLLENGRMKISVKSSASPIIYIFSEPRKIRRLYVRGNISKLPLLSNADDFLLRIGPAISGEKRLSFFERLAAPNWIRSLDEIAKAKKLGFGHLDLGVISSRNPPAWKNRVHPQSDLIRETAMISLAVPGEFSFEQNYTKELPLSLGIWIGSDGDDSKTEFNLTIEELSIEYFEI